MDVPSPPTLITLSFSGDLDCCRLLCETADRFAPAGAAHLLAVPAADMPLFRPLAGGRRALVPQEELLPGWLRKLPCRGRNGGGACVCPGATSTSRSRGGRCGAGSPSRS